MQKTEQPESRTGETVPDSPRRATAAGNEKAAAFTPGPWRWEVNLKSRSVSLNGGVPRFDLQVMDFVRWGMGSAAPRLLKRWDRSGLMVMEHVSRFAVPVAGREHHSEWFRTLDHPDAHLIAASPELYEACRDALAFLNTIEWTDDTSANGAHDLRIELARVIEKVEGR